MVPVGECPEGGEEDGEGGQAGHGGRMMGVEKPAGGEGLNLAGVARGGAGAAEA